MPQSLILFFGLVSFTKALTCEEFLQNSDGDTLFTPSDLSSLGIRELEKCLAELGEKQLEVSQAELLWRFLEYGGDPGTVPENSLKVLGWNAVGIPPSDYQNITAIDIDVVEAFGRFHDLNTAQLSALAEQVKSNWAGKSAEDYSQYDLMALRQILCAFNKSEILKIHAKAYKGAAMELGKLQRCPHYVLQGLAELAMSADAFGHTSCWSKIQVNIVGIVYTGLSDEDIKLIPPESLPDPVKT